MKKVGIIGSGDVGQQLGLGFIKSGWQVMMGTRTPLKHKDWEEKAGKNASLGSDMEAAEFGEFIVLATKWTGTENAINLAGKENFKGKIVIDVTNPLASDKSGNTKLALGFPNSGGATVQKWLPDAKVVKAFNIVSAFSMTNPNFKEGTPDMFIAGNDKGAKKAVSDIAKEWGWPVTDIGGIEEAYLMESLTMIWLKYGEINNIWSHAWKMIKK